jgi:hypothetical protein
LKIRSGHFLEVVIFDFSSAGRHQENFGRTSTKNAQAAKSANAHCNFGASRALRRSLSVIHSGTDLACRPGLTVRVEGFKLRVRSLRFRVEVRGLRVRGLDYII